MLHLWISARSFTPVTFAGPSTPLQHYAEHGTTSLKFMQPWSLAPNRIDETMLLALGRHSSVEEIQNLLYMTSQIHHLS